MDTEDKLFVDFISKCIEWDTAERLTPEQALNHPWIVEGLREIVSLQEEEDKKIISK